MTRTKLFLSAVVKYLMGILFFGVMLFLPAGTLNFPGGWLLMGTLMLPMLVMGIVMFFKAPALLEKRLDPREKQTAQKGVIGFSALMFLAVFILAGLDFRFGWSQLPIWVKIAAAVLLLIAYTLYAEVLRENAYLSRTIEVQEGQTVVSTGLYGIVRHPMYAVTLLLFAMMPLMLGSLPALAVMVIYPILIVVRILDEEKLLTKELQGYADYKKKVKYRLIPFIW